METIGRTALFVLFWTLLLVYGLPTAIVSTTVVGGALWLSWEIVALVFGV